MTVSRHCLFDCAILDFLLTSVIYREFKIKQWSGIGISHMKRNCVHYPRESATTPQVKVTLRTTKSLSHVVTNLTSS